MVTENTRLLSVVYNIIDVFYFGNIDQMAIKFKVSYSYRC